jgi:hypothetical protein
VPCWHGKKAFTYGFRKTRNLHLSLPFTELNGLTSTLLVNAQRTLTNARMLPTNKELITNVTTRIVPEYSTRVRVYFSSLQYK